MKKSRVKRHYRRCHSMPPKAGTHRWHNFRGQALAAGRPVPVWLLLLARLYPGVNQGVFAVSVASTPGPTLPTSAEDVSVYPSAVNNASALVIQGTGWNSSRTVSVHRAKPSGF